MQRIKENDDAEEMANNCMIIFSGILANLVCYSETKFKFSRDNATESILSQILNCLRIALKKQPTQLHGELPFVFVVGIV